jgi:hypothetical protein
MLFRAAPGPESSVWRRFRPRADLFTFRREGAHCVARVGAGAERAVEHFHALAAMLPATVDLTVDCLRSRRTYQGQHVALDDARDWIARLKGALVAAGGVEFALHTADEQLTLTPLLDVFIHAPSDRWVYLLLGRGLEERDTLPPLGWTVARDAFEGAAELVAAIAAGAERLGLRAGETPR